MNDPADKYVEAGQALLQLGRWIQRSYPHPNVQGSQFKEDAILAELLPGDKGIYVDVGASHPKECSNTWPFYQRGWRGLLIEPLPDCWGQILMERREDRLCPMAASNGNGVATLHLCRSLSSLRPDWNKDVTETIPCHIAPLRDILALHKDFDWTRTGLCSIDVEGHEKEVLEGIDWSTFRPAVIIIEYCDYRTGEGVDVSDSWRQDLSKHGYHVHYKNQLNQIWTRIRR
jgi:FkbM family methyltransferase